MSGPFAPMHVSPNQSNGSGAAVGPSVAPVRALMEAAQSFRCSVAITPVAPATWPTGGASSRDGSRIGGAGDAADCAGDATASLSASDFLRRGGFGTRVMVLQYASSSTL